MDRNELNKMLCAIITTLEEVESAPENILYVGTGCDLAKYETVKSVLIGGNLATLDNREMRLTQAGHDMAAKINAYAIR
jgi:hypothetical protein